MMEYILQLLYPLEDEMANYRAELTGVFGNPVDDNPTGVMEEAAYRSAGLNYRYITMKVLPDGLKDAILGMRAVGMKGVNITMPHKVTVLPYLDELSEAASIIGAVNTITMKDGRLFGENTDGKGFVTSVKNAGYDITGEKITILGAGGAARAIAVECALEGAASITIINRSAIRGKELTDLINDKTRTTAAFLSWPSRVKIPANTDILINATSIGLMPDSDMQPDIDFSSIRPGILVCDVVFNPADTKFLKSARAAGAKTLSGLGMLVQQGALNFTLWTGEEAPIDVMYEALKKEFEQ